MKSIEQILEENKKFKHLFEIVYYQKHNLVNWKLIGADTVEQAIKKARVKPIEIIQHS